MLLCCLQQQLHQFTASSLSSPPLDEQSSHSDSEPPIKVAYAISLIECTDNHKSGQSSIAGLVDASLVLRHSIHQNSVRNPSSGSKYDYEMFAIIHRQAESCAPVLQKAGFTTVIRDPPLQTSEIRGNFLRKKIHTALCCGIDEFVKLYAFVLPGDNPVVVHLDIDYIIAKPMDAVIDSMMGNTSELTRSKVEREYTNDPWPIEDGSPVEAMITRDYHSAGAPGRKAGFQAGFWVLKPSQTHFHAVLDVVREGNYVEGFSRENGWGSLGYGGFVGAMAMQGLMAYYYDVIAPGTSVELNNCRYNSVAATVRKKGLCQRDGGKVCEDCMTTAIEDIYSIHYTACRKPWSCINRRTDDKTNTFHRKYSIPVNIVNYDHCMDALKVWHDVRRDLEVKLYALTKDDDIKKGRQGSYNLEFFLGHCAEDQSKGYLRIAGGNPETLERIPELYKNSLTLL